MGVGYQFTSYCVELAWCGELRGTQVRDGEGYRGGDILCDWVCDGSGG
jgi:hypothetical protein